VTLGVARWLGYVGSALLVGVLIVLGWCWRAGWASVRARRLMTLGGVLLAAGAVADLRLKGPYVAALGLGATFHGDLLREVLGSTYGRATLARIVLALIGLEMAWRRVRSLGAAVILSLAVGVSFALAGHAAAGSGHVFAAVNDTVHVVAASVWLGGLVLLLVAVLPERDAEASRIALTRFSGLALVMVMALVATGLYQAIRQVGSLGAATGTTYGRELLVKVGLVVVLVALGALSRRRLAQGAVRLRAAVGAETVLIAVVLGISATLVATEPAKTAYHPTVSAQVTLVGDTVQVSAVPVGDRTVELHLYVFGKDGQPSDPKEIAASISLPARSIDALPVTLQNAGPGHRQAVVAAPMTGEWRLAITVRTTAIDEATGYVTLPIR
jgi:copper transport protein